MSLTDFKAKMNTSKINKYKIILIIKQIQSMNLMLYKGNNKIIYERYKQDISKDTLQMQNKS